jgi:8-oxo-dGTP pyrophosphatase MutT (NUDIX family)
VSVPNGELVEVVERDGTVTGVVTRAEMRRQNLRHRSTYVVVRSGADRSARVLAHHRAPWKDVWPDRWDLAFGGVCGVKETWDAAARRELAEEAGIEGALHRLGSGSFESAEVKVLAEIYETRHDGPFRFADGEVTGIAWVPMTELAAWMAGRDLCPDTVALVTPHLR